MFFTNNGRHLISILAATTACLCAVAVSAGGTQTTGTVTRVPVVVSGGHETDPRDHGRPVVLIAGALGVSPEVFREAFSHVKPAPAGTEPDPAQVRQNKSALMSALGKYGITNERLDTVSNYYRYNGRRGEMWPTRPAAAMALVANGAVTGFEISNPGSGYSSPPQISVPGAVTSPARAELTFGPKFETNGAVKQIKVQSH